MYCRLIYKGHKKTLEETDLWKPSPRHLTSSTLPLLEAAWKKETTKYHRFVVFDFYIHVDLLLAMLYERISTFKICDQIYGERGQRKGFYSLLDILKITNISCFLWPRQRGLWAAYTAPISTIFETTYVNRCQHAYTGKNKSNFCVGVSQAKKCKYMV